MMENNNEDVIDEVLIKHGLDRRKRYFSHMGILCTGSSITQACTGCNEHGEYEISPLVGSGCHECGYTGKRVNFYPVPVEVNGKTISLNPQPHE